MVVSMSELYERFPPGSAPIRQKGKGQHRINGGCVFRVALYPKGLIKAEGSRRGKRTGVTGKALPPKYRDQKRHSFQLSVLKQGFERIATSSLSSSAVHRSRTGKG